MPIVDELIPGRQAGGVVKPCGSLWPNGEFTLGYSYEGGLEGQDNPIDYYENGALRLGSSIDSNSHSMKDEGLPKRGAKGLTSYGKRVLRNSVWRMQRLHGKGRLAFVTLTLPSVSYEAAWNISSDWSRVVRVFFQKLGRYLNRLGLPNQYASCTEMQTERMRRDGHPGLHLHFVICTKRRGERGWAITPGEIRWLWASVIGPMCGEIEYWGAVENVQRIRKDAGAYMSKYMSKGCSMESPPRSDETGWGLPTAWYNVCLELKRWVKDNTRKSPEMFLLLESAIRVGECPSAFRYLFSGTIEECTGPGPHYWVGMLTGEFFRELVDIWKAGRMIGG